MRIGVGRVVDGPHVGRCTFIERALVGCPVPDTRRTGVRTERERAVAHSNRGAAVEWKKLGGLRCLIYALHIVIPVTDDTKGLRGNRGCASSRLSVVPFVDRQEGLPYPSVRERVGVSRE